ncbi:hypothetical protein GLOIN_2v1815633 [Rhizophagus irregularis DAOM 181602=DAOM 197198]|nr:hypothetical protein GLOIN_2v1815633 [Rhizophagus irregularis DAOM 181602=DAOM 197198]
MEIPIFYGVKGENPKEWTDQVEKYLLKIGVKDDKRIFEIARTHLLDNAKEWLENEGVYIVNWNKNEIKWLNLKFRIIDKYAKWKEVKNKLNEKDNIGIENAIIEQWHDTHEIRGMKYINEHEERCEHKDTNISQMGECKITTHRNNRKCINKRDVEIEKVRRMLRDTLSEVLKDKDQNEKIL